LGLRSREKEDPTKRQVLCLSRNSYLPFGGVLILLFLSASELEEPNKELEQPNKELSLRSNNPELRGSHETPRKELSPWEEEDPTKRQVQGGEEAYDALSL